jgi:hypothetical protein
MAKTFHDNLTPDAVYITPRSILIEYTKHKCVSISKVSSSAAVTERLKIHINAVAKREGLQLNVRRRLDLAKRLFSDGLTVQWDIR